MIDSDNLLAGEISRQRPDRIVKAFNEGYLVVGSDETNDAVCVMTAIGMPGDGAPPHTHIREDETFIIHEGRPDFPTLVKIGANYGIQIEGPPAS
jgi:mannose-6-phosphate isomerase-like protein (cupin superfamily)